MPARPPRIIRFRINKIVAGKFGRPAPATSCGRECTDLARSADPNTCIANSTTEAGTPVPHGAFEFLQLVNNSSRQGRSVFPPSPHLKSDLSDFSTFGGEVG